MKNDHGTLPVRVEGMPQARWVVMDYVDAVMHAFVPEVRDFYRLEQLWGEVPRLDAAGAGRRLVARRRSGP